MIIVDVDEWRDMGKVIRMKCSSRYGDREGRMRNQKTINYKWANDKSA
jgi:hypothetical protein